MIFDRIRNFLLYPNLPKQLLDFVEHAEFKEGKIEIEGDIIFAIGLNYETKNESEGLWEAHRRYLDIHYIIQGEELVHVSHIDRMKPINEYQDDFQLFEGKPTHEVLLTAGDFLVLYPHEVHKTSIINKGVSNVKKFVIKVLLP